MSAFYTNVFTMGDLVYYRGVKSDHTRVQKQHPYRPYLFMETNNANLAEDYRTIDGKMVKKINFSSMSEARRHIAKYKEVSGVTVYGLNQFQYTFLHDLFPGEVEYDSSQVKIAYLDIEVASDTGFPRPENAEKEVTAITFKHNDSYYVFGCGEDYWWPNSNVFYYKAENEKKLLEDFLIMWEGFGFDIVTGWNVRFFDIPYLVKRIAKICGNDAARLLSPWMLVEERLIESRGKERLTYELYGLTILDYQELYKKFTFTNHESYALENVSMSELGEGKVKFRGTFEELYKTDYKKFIDYNMRDVDLVKRLEDKFGFLELVLSLAYDAKCNYIDVLTTIRPWDVIIHNYLLDRNIVIPPVTEHHLLKHIAGAHVKEPRIGFSNWVVAFDLRSLYPHLMMMYNISPETFMGRSNAHYKIENGEVKLYGAEDVEDDVTITANGCLYRKDRQGFMPALMEMKFKDRAFFQKKMRAARDAGDSKAEFLFDKKQHAKKIQLNSLYGSLLNLYNRWFSFDNGEAVTTTGQLVIKFVDKVLNIYLNEFFETKNEDYIIASDTDSVYICLEKYVDMHLPNWKPKMTENQIVDALDAFSKEVISPFLEQKFVEFAKATMAYDQKLFMNRETISSKGLWRAKKMYILNVLDKEGKRFDPAKPKFTGIEVVRSSTPLICKEHIKKAISIIMNGSERDLIKFITEFKAKYKTLPFEDIAMPRTASNLEEYSDPVTIYKLRTPVQVKGALLYNKCLEKHKLTNLPSLGSGDKTKFCYLKLPNPIHDTVIGAPGELPPEFGLDKYLDYNKQFEASFLKPIQSLTDAINWNIDNRATLEAFFE